MPSSSTSTARSRTTSRSCAAIYEAMFAEHGRPMTAAEYYGQLAGRTEEAIIGSWLGVDGRRARGARRRADRPVRDGSPVTVRRSGRKRARRCATRRRAFRSRSSPGAFRAEIAPALEGAGLGRALLARSSPRTTSHTASHIRRATSGRCACSAPGREPGDALAFEDTEAGVASAKAAGLRCVGVLGTMGPERLGEADELVERIDVGLLRRLLG